MQVNTDMASEVTVPETHNGTPVTAILDGAFYQKSITSVNIPASVTNIGNDVFWHANYVSVSYYGTLAQWCNVSSLEGMFIRRTSDKTTVQVRSDDDTKWLRLQGTEVDNNTTTTARSVYIPDGADHVAAYALFNSYVTEISLPASVKTIGNSAFNYIGGITITFRGTVGEWCEIEGLGDCMALEYYKRNVIIDGVDYRDLETIVIEDGTTKIAPYAFHSGSAGYNVPYRNTTLKNIVIPTSVTSIGNNSFGTCTAIECVFYKGTPDEWAAVDNRGWFGDQANVYCYSYDMPTQAGHFWHYNTDEETPVVWDEFVDIKVERVELEHRSLMLALGDRIQLKAFVYPENASDKSVVWNITAGKSGATIDWSTGELAINTDYTTTTVEITATSAASRYYTDEIFATCTVTIGTIAEYDRVNNGSGYANEWYVKSCDNNNRPTKLVIASEHQTMGGNQVYEVTEIGSGAFSKLAQLEEVWIPSTVTKISTDLLFRADRTVTIYYDITLEEAREMDLSGFTNGKDADVTRTVYFRNPETGRIDVPMPQED